VRKAGPGFAAFVTAPWRRLGTPPRSSRFRSHTRSFASSQTGAARPPMPA